MPTKYTEYGRENKMNYPEVKKAIRLLKSKGITIKEIEEVYRYYDYLQKKNDPSAKELFV